MVEGLISIVIDPLFKRNNKDTAHKSEINNTCWKQLTGRDNRYHNIHKTVNASTLKENIIANDTGKQIVTETNIHKRKFSTHSTGLKLLLTGSRLNIPLENALEFIWVSNNAATIIQRACRKYYHVLMVRRFRRKSTVLKIEIHVKKFLMRKKVHKVMLSNCACIVQRLFRAHYRSKQIAACLIQKCYRRYYREKRRRLKLSVRSIQKLVRGYSERQKYKRMQASVKYLQRMWRHQLKARHILLIRSLYNCYKRERVLAILTTAATVIQRHFRGYLHRQRYQYMYKCIVGLQLRRRYLFTIRRKKAAIKLQARMRCYIERTKFLKIKRGMIALQAIHRRNHCVLLYRRCRYVIIRCQGYRRGIVFRKILKIVRRQVIRLQSNWRGSIQRKRFQQQRLAATQIQISYRYYMQCKRHRILVQKMGIIKRYMKKYLHRTRIRRFLVLWKYSVFLIRVLYKARQSLMYRRLAVNKIQRCYLRYQERKKRTGACVIIARAWRIFKNRKIVIRSIRELVHQHLNNKQRLEARRYKAAVTLQSCWKRYKSVKAYKALKLEISEQVRSRVTFRNLDLASIIFSNKRNISNTLGGWKIYSIYP